MFKKEMEENNKPLIFSKKLNDNNRTIPLTIVKNTLGPIRYFPPATQEWFNSVYAYNNNYIKNISVADKNLSRLIKSYFNLYLSKNLLYRKRILTRFRRLATNKIFISKAELKHTSNKVVITLYVYNEERRRLLNRLKRIERVLFPNNTLVSDKVKKSIFLLLSLKKRLNFIKKQKDKLSLIGWLKKLLVYINKEIKLERKALSKIKNFRLKQKKLLYIETLEKNLKIIFIILSSCKKDPVFLKHYKDIYNKFLIKIILEKEMALLSYCKLLLSLNKNKFEDIFISRIKPLISKIYNKEVEFNIVNLKAIYLNSDLFTQAISLKLRNRRNKLLRVLRSFLYMVKLPKSNFLSKEDANINIKNLWVNKVKNLTLSSLALNTTRDSINDMLTSLFSKCNFSKKLAEEKSDKESKIVRISLTNSLTNSVLLLLKNKSMAGVRLEAKGRLTRRFTASRSVFKIKWKGSLKNIDSSYRGLSSVILRGHIKSNVQYSIVNSKTRNGAFGLKGWISGK